MATRKEITPAQAALRMEALCARGEYSRGEVIKKMRSWGLSASDASLVADHLEDAGFVDDRRFAAAYVDDKVRFARWGRRKIALGLRSKGIDASLSAEAMDEIDPQVYADNIVALVRQKARQIDDADTYEGRQRILRFMLSRGFEPSLVIKVINNPRLWTGEE